MNAFIVELENKPGELGRVTGAIADKGIDVRAFSGATCGSSGSLVLVTNDEAGTRRALAEARCSTREIELVTVGIEDRPGGLAEIARLLGDAGVNIEAACPTGMSGNKVQVAFATSDPARARSVLGDRVMTGAMA